MALISPRYNLATNPFIRKRSEHTLSSLKYIFGGLMEAPLTPKQDVIFSFALQAVLKADNPSLDTFRTLIDSKRGTMPDYIERCEPLVREFFITQFYETNYDQTKKEISWRLWSLLKEPKLASMFTAPMNKVELRNELHRKLILIDCDIDILKDFTGFFGRMFIAQILEIAHERFRNPGKPIYVYIDECYFYLDQNVVSLLETARKANVGMILAHQYLAQIKDPAVREALLSLTSTKLAGTGLSASDKHTIAQAMDINPDHFSYLKEYEFILAERHQPTQIVTADTRLWTTVQFVRIPDGIMMQRYAYVPDETITDEPTIEAPKPRKPRV